MKKYFLVILGCTLILAAFYIYQGQSLSDNRLHVIFCDVGQGDGILIRTPQGADIVIDGGPANGKMLDCLENYMPQADRDIEIMFATHSDADHIGGLVDILKSYKVLSYATSGAVSDTEIFRTLNSLINKYGIPYREISEGDRFTLTDGVVIETLWPPQGFESRETNEHSLVQVIKFGDFEALVTGDVTYRILDSLSFDYTFEVFKLSHHGSKTGTDRETLEKIRAYLAIISSGKNNSYHHPHPSVLSLLKKYNLAYKRTDESGNIEIITDGKNTKVLN
jgi:competence protein ComEC